MGKFFPGDKSSLKREKKKKKKKLLKTVPFKQDEKDETLKELKKFKSVPELERRKTGAIVTDFDVGKLLNLISGDTSTLKRKRKENKLFKAIPLENKVVKIETMTNYRNQKIKRIEESEESESESHVTGQNMHKKLKREGKIQFSEEPSEDETEAQKIEMRKREVFVGNMPKKVNAKSIVNLFSEYGEIEWVRMKSPFTAEKRNNRCVYVRFKDVKSAKKATAVNGQIFLDHHLIVNMASDNVSQDAKKAVFLGNLCLDIDEDTLWKMFEPCGDIANVRIVRDRYTGVGTGIAFINFKENDAVEKALTFDGIPLKDRSIRVQRYKKGNMKSKKTIKKNVTEPGLLSTRPQKRKVQDSNVSNTGNDFFKSKKSKKLLGSDNTSSENKSKKEFSFQGKKVAENGLKKKKKTKLNKEKRKKKKLIEKISDTSKPSKKQVKRKPLAKKMKFVPSSQ